MSSGSRPNGDETFQRKDWVEILKTDKSQFTCEVIHGATGKHVEEEWGQSSSSSSSSSCGLVQQRGIMGVLVFIADIKKI